MLPDSNPMLALAVILIAGVFSGHLASRVRLPAVTGQILAGILVGPAVFNFLDLGDIHALEPITDFALSLIAVTVGSHLHLKRLLNAKKRLSLQLLFESTLTPGLVFLAVVLIGGESFVLAGLLAALAVSTAPATIVAIVKETHSKGVFVKTLVAAVALNNIACVCLFEVAHTAAQIHFDPGRSHSTLNLIMSPFRELLLSGIVGGLTGIALVLATRHVVRSDRLATASMIGILATTGLAHYVGVSSLLSCLFLGMALANLTPEKDELGHGVFENFETAIYGVFFTLAGAQLEFQYLAAGGVLAIIVVLARFIGKVAASSLAMGLAGATRRVRQNLGLALVPQAGVAVGLLLVVQADPIMAPIKDLLLAVGLAVVTAGEVIGPILTRTALARAGEVGKARARLIDFIHEENITTELHADDKEGAIRQMTALMVRSHHLEMSEEELFQSVMERENEISTCIGGGLAIPHGVLVGRGESILGVMGISREGLQFETPDGNPVHCMVLLATPPSRRDRHLEVLAALARAIGSDRNVQSQLFNAHSPAHAYEIIHVEESEGFNYFLDRDDI